jgi:hypothetical protein
MMKFASEKAMALVDGQLPPAHAPELVQELARNPALMADLQKYLAMARGRIAQPYESRRQDPVPQWLIDTVLYTPTAARRPSWGPIGYLQSLVGRFRERYSVPAWSLAAGPALAGTIVAVSAWLLLPTSTMGAYASLSDALDRTVSGTQAAVLTKVHPVLSFRSKTNALCRQYDVLHGAKQASHAVACRESSGGEWRVVISTPPGPVGRDMKLAGTPERKTIEEYVEANSAQDLDMQQEQQELRKARQPR